MKNILMMFVLILTTQIYTQSDNSKDLENGINLFNQEKYNAAGKDITNPCLIPAGACLMIIVKKVLLNNKKLLKINTT